MTEWLNYLQLVAFGNHNNGNTSAGSTNSSLDSNANQFFNNGINSLPMKIINNLSEAQSEENLLYASVDAPDIYRIKLIDTDASIRCGLKSNLDSYFTLIVTSVSISLAEDGKVLFTWPFRHIRRYGCTKEGFSLEAGRKCVSGDGLFSFVTRDGNSIFQSVATHVNSLKASRNLTDDQIPGVTSLGASGLSPHLKHKETLPFQNQSYFSNETKPLLPSTPPPTSTTYLPKTGYFATNSSLLPSSKLPETTKRHSVQPPKSPQMIPKTALTRVTSVSTTTTNVTTDAFSNNELKLKPSPPITKPPRKSKESKALDSDEPLFASREEVLGLNTETNESDIRTQEPIIDDEILYDEPGDITTHGISQNNEQMNKTPFCPSPPPVTQTVSKLTSVLKMMFSGHNVNQVHTKHNKDSKRVQSARSSTGSSGNNSGLSSPTTTSPVKIDSINELAYAQVSIDSISNKSDRNQLSSDNTNKDVIHYSKILNESNNCSTPTNEYANISYHDFNDFNKPIDNKTSNVSHTEHYVQNDCEYARVVKRTINNTSTLERKN
jgi:hypothetical protein